MMAKSSPSRGLAAVKLRQGCAFVLSRTALVAPILDTERLTALLVGVEAGRMTLYTILIGWPKSQFQGPHSSLQPVHAGAVPMAATGTGGPRSRPPSKRQDTWGVMAIDVSRRGWVA